MPSMPASTGRTSACCAPQTLGAVRPYCFYGTDASHLLHRAGMQGIVCGPGGKYNTMPDERVERRDFIDMIRIYLLAIEKICGLTGAAPSEQEATG